MGKFDHYAFSAHPSFNEAATREAFSRAVPLRTLVIYCYDPRATEIPDAVAKLFGDEVFPGEIILDGAGNRVASSTTIFPIIVAEAAPSTRFVPSPSRSTCSGSERHRGPPLALRRDQLHRRRHRRCLSARAPSRYLEPLPAKQHLHHRLRGFAQARHRLHPLACRHAKAREYFRLLL